MSFKVNKRRENKEQWLLSEINAVIQNTGYTLFRFKLDANAFGNVIVEIIKDSTTIRFIQDKGDVCMDKKEGTEGRWTDQQLIFSHSCTTGETYNTLIQAIKQIVS